MVDTAESKQEPRYSSWFSCCMKSFPPTSHTKMPSEDEMDDQVSKYNDMKVVITDSQQRKPGGWKSMPFIIGNETFERLAAFGLLANFLVYLKREYHMENVEAANLIYIYSGIANFAPLLGAFVSDAYIGRFWSIFIGSVAGFLGMVTLTITSSVPSLKPAPCPLNYQKDQQLQPQSLGSCAKASGGQIGFLVLSLALLIIGTAGVRPCSLPFGVDQFDNTTVEGRRGINSYYNWYYTTFTIVVMLALTVMVYIQDSVSWIWGFGIPTSLMFCSIVLFLVGRKLYIHVKPGGSVFFSIFKVFVAAYRKRGLELLPNDMKDGAYYDPLVSGSRQSKLPLSNQFSFLNKSAMIQEGEVSSDGTPKPTSKWTLCSIQDVEEVKCLIRVLPIWSTGIVCFTAVAQQSTYAILQATIMNRHIGTKFLIPPGSITIISMIVVGIWVPIYDRFVVPALRKITNHEEGITLLQRMGIGNVFSILSMVIAGLVEQKRRNLANNHHQTLSIFWLTPQLAMLGFAEAFNFIGQIEFYNKQFPEKLSSVATSLFFCTIAGANYLSAVVVSLVRSHTATHGKPNWLTNDLNQGKLDYFYFLLAIMGLVNFVYFLLCAKKYRYKGSVELEGKHFRDIELIS